MYPQKVLQGIPNLERTANFFVLDFLVMAERQPQFVSHCLLGQTRRFAGIFQIIPH